MKKVVIRTILLILLVLGGAGLIPLESILLSKINGEIVRKACLSVAWLIATAHFFIEGPKFRSEREKQMIQAKVGMPSDPVVNKLFYFLSEVNIVFYCLTIGISLVGVVLRVRATARELELVTGGIATIIPVTVIVRVVIQKTFPKSSKKFLRGFLVHAFSHCHLNSVSQAWDLVRGNKTLHQIDGVFCFKASCYARLV